MQLSGKLAWEGLCAESERHNGIAQLFTFGESDRDSDDCPPVNSIATRTKQQALRAALGRRWHPQTILIWHIDLLKLLPFFRAYGARVVLFLHGIEVWRRQDLMTRLLLRHVDLVLSNTDYTWTRAAQWQPHLARIPHRTVHLGAGTPVGIQPPVPRDPPAALMLSRLQRGEDYKGHRETIAAWRHVLVRHPAAELWIAGDGDLRPDLERLARSMGLQRHIQFSGRITETQKEDLLARSRLLALPSRGEGFGLVYLEAMRLGRPCLVSTVDAGREVVNPPEAGLAVDPDRPQAIADAVCDLLAAGENWERWSQQARRRYETRFTATHFQQRLHAALFARTIDTDSVPERAGI